MAAMNNMDVWMDRRKPDELGDAMCFNHTISKETANKGADNCVMDRLTGGGQMDGDKIALLTHTCAPHR